jgi:predicted metal-dependent hydrolase
MERRRTLELVVAGERVRAEVRESRRARRLRLTVRDGRPLQVTVPRGTGERALRRFLDESTGWIADRLDEARERAARLDVLGLARPGTAWLEGRALEVVRVPGRAGATRRGDMVAVAGPEPAAALERWYRREARRLFETSVAHESARLGLEYARIAIRDQRTRWGSCSSRGTLSFNWRLALTPPEVLDYVVVHELLHVREHNHSRAFWALVGEHRPGWRAQMQWLRDHGAELQAYDPATAFTASPRFRRV